MEINLLATSASSLKSPLANGRAKKQWVHVHIFALRDIRASAIPHNLPDGQYGLAKLRGHNLYQNRSVSM